MPTIDPITAGIFGGLAVEGIKAIVSIGRPDPRLVTDPEELRREGLRRRLAADASLDSVLQEAAASVCRSLEFEGPDAEDLRGFLRSPSALAIVRQIYASKLAEEQNARLDSIRSEFESALNLHIGERTSQEVSAVFDTMLDSCEMVLEVALANNVLSAHEAKSVVRHRFLTDELASIQRNLEFLTARKGLDIGAVLEFEDKYRRQVS